QPAAPQDLRQILDPAAYLDTPSRIVEPPDLRGRISADDDQPRRRQRPAHLRPDLGDQELDSIDIGLMQEAADEDDILSSLPGCEPAGYAAHQGDPADPGVGQARTDPPALMPAPQDRAIGRGDRRPLAGAGGLGLRRHFPRAGELCPTLLAEVVQIDG